MSSSNWNSETKARLSEKTTANILEITSLTRQVLRESRSSELLAQAAKNFAFQETSVENSLTTMKRMGLASSHLHYQSQAIQKSVEQLPEINNQLVYILHHPKH